MTPIPGRFRPSKRGFSIVLGRRSMRPLLPIDCPSYGIANRPNGESALQSGFQHQPIGLEFRSMSKGETQVEALIPRFAPPSTILKMEERFAPQARKSRSFPFLRCRAQGEWGGGLYLGRVLDILRPFLTPFCDRVATPQTGCD